MAPQRLTYRRRHAYNTRSNKVRKVKTPGGRLTFHYLSKKPNPPLCGECRVPISGVPALRPKAYRTIKPHHRTVSRVYGGNLCASCVRDRIVRAFLVEEQKIVKSVLKQRKANEKKTEAPATAATTKA